MASAGTQIQETSMLPPPWFFNAPRTPKLFHGDSYENVDDCLDDYNRCASVNDWNKQRKLRRADSSMTEEKKVRLLMRGVKEQLFAGLVRNPPSTVGDFLREATMIKRMLSKRSYQYELPGSFSASPYSWLVVPAACVFVTTLAVALVAFLTLGSSSSHDYDDDTFGDGNGPSGNVLYTQTTTTGKTSAYESTPSPATPSQAPSQSQPVTVPTMPLTMTTHILASTLAPTTTSTTAATIGPPTTTTQVPLPPGSLVCTIGQGFDKSTYTFPPDGLCTIIIFDSLYRNNASLAPPYPNDFAYFLETARQAERTEFGIGIHQE
ncbi:uncharacterized protein LOC142789997 [Rhipicephalus microplus]|uniref:uncharacterized protein LOC142789997 n=1 Tax=Rhipicephalus microplus TaxID=6941 RepID=UPI003F6D8AFA